jgi:hypothetical protein
MTWIDIWYRDFYDIPRTFVFETGSKSYLADCPFDEQLDDYLSFYTLYELPPIAALSLDGSWEKLPNQAIREIGRIKVTDIVFDDSMRQQVELSSFRKML